MTNSKLEILLNNLDKGFHGITPSFGKFLSEASAYCLALKSHSPSVEMEIQGSSPQICKVFWTNEINEQTKNAWNDTQELTEYGASGIAILLIVNITGFTVIRRARKGEGVDYWLGKEKSIMPFQDAARLEISGILDGNNSQIEARIKQKLLQTQPTDGEIPAYIVVVEFSKPYSKMVQK